MIGRCAEYACRKEVSAMNNQGQNTKAQWAAPKLQRLSARLAESGGTGLSDGPNTNRS